MNTTMQPHINPKFLRLGAAAWAGGWLTLAAFAAAPTPESERWFEVLRSGDARPLQAALDRGARVNDPDANGNTPLHHAVVYGDTACVRLLLDHGATIKATNHLGSTPLLRAAMNYEKLALLVERGADVNVHSALGHTPLMVAARAADSHRAVRLLLEKGADVKATNLFGATALMAAAAGGDARSVKLLLDHGADANARPAFSEEGFVFGGGRSPLTWAAYRGDLTSLQLLADAGADVNAEAGLGTALSQTAWADRAAAAQWLLDHGAKVNQSSQMDGYTPLHWAASTENSDTALVDLLLQRGANADAEGGAHIDAFMDVAQTPLMLARRRGETEILSHLRAAGATKETPDRMRAVTAPDRELPAQLDPRQVRTATSRAVPLLQESAIISKRSFANHASRQDCVSCHQQSLPMAAIGLAKQQRVAVDAEKERALIAMTERGEFKQPEFDWVPLFHPDAVFTKGYAMLGFALAGLPANEYTDAAVHHLAAIQGADGRWFSNLSRPPIQTDDIGATALAVHALQKFPLPGRQAEFSQRVERAKSWLWQARPQNQEGRVYQLLGLAWAGEPANKLQGLAKALAAGQHVAGGWAQLPKLAPDAYATGQAIYALRVAAGWSQSQPAIERGRRFLVTTQLEDGSWYVRRRAFPFQPTMESGFPHGKDSWISAAGTSWAVMALSLPDGGSELAQQP